MVSFFLCLFFFLQWLCGFVIYFDASVVIIVHSFVLFAFAFAIFCFCFCCVFLSLLCCSGSPVCTVKADCESGVVLGRNEVPHDLVLGLGGYTGEAEEEGSGKDP